MRKKAAKKLRRQTLNLALSDYKQGRDFYLEANVVTLTRNQKLKINNAAWYAAHKEWSLKKSRAYRKANPERCIWVDMIRRCSDPKRKSYENYGGRGITVCQRWLDSYPDFLVDMGRRPAGKFIDRKNNDGNYEPSNCRWVTRSEQNANRRGWAK